MQPFRFVTSSVFTVPRRGVVFTGQLVEGRVQRGQRAVVGLPSGTRDATITAIDCRRKSVASADAGEEVGLYLEGVDASDIPSVAGQGGMVQESGGLAGVTVVAWEAS